MISVNRCASAASGSGPLFSDATLRSTSASRSGRYALPFPLSLPISAACLARSLSIATIFSSSASIASLCLAMSSAMSGAGQVAHCEHAFDLRELADEGTVHRTVDVDQGVRHLTL